VAIWGLNAPRAKLRRLTCTKEDEAAGVGVFGNVVEGSMRGLQADSNLCGGDVTVNCRRITQLRVCEPLELAALLELEEACRQAFAPKPLLLPRDLSQSS
jgi:hypothetical protein